MPQLRAVSGWSCGNWTRAGPLPDFSPRKALARQDRRPRAPRLANPDFPMELGRLPWDFEREKGASAVPPNGSALHHLVTAVSVKKALPRLLELLASKGSPTCDY